MSSYFEDGFAVGVVVGVALVAIGVLVFVLTYKRPATRVLAALHDHGAGAAMTVLDRRVPALGKIGISKIIEQRERMAALALIGNVVALEHELAEHTGGVSAVSQVNAVAMLGLALRGDAASAADMLNRLAHWTEHEGGHALGLVKKKVRAFAILAAGVAGTPVPPEAWPRIEGVAREGGMLSILVCRAIAVAHASSGNQAAAAPWDQKVRARTRVFDSPPVA